jgi:hypothetical protein
MKINCFSIYDTKLKHIEARFRLADKETIGSWNIVKDLEVDWGYTPPIDTRPS